MVVIDLRSPTAKFLDRQRELNNLPTLSIKRVEETQIRQIQILKNKNDYVQAGVTTQASL